jgi:phosphoribosylformylglycinamidine synthase I
MSARVAVVVFPGTNCECDCAHALGELGADVDIVWHAERDLSGADVVVLPGGFAHGDYLRTGAIARFSPVMDAVRGHAAAGGYVIGVCNGFQILCEAGLLPGVLRRNAGLRFVCRWVDVRVENAATAFTTRARPGDVLRLPINHFEGNWFCDEAALQELRARGGIVLRYRDNPNGALDDVAGIIDDSGRILGLMPHPERACEELLGSSDGVVILGSLLDNARAQAPLAAGARA